MSKNIPPSDQKVGGSNPSERTTIYLFQDSVGGAKILHPDPGTAEGPPGGILAHSTHVKGIGTYEDGVERPRVKVVLATGISEDECRVINLGYRDPATICVSDYQGREAEGILHVPKAGEMLYRWKDAPPELGGTRNP